MDEKRSAMSAHVSETLEHHVRWLAGVTPARNYQHPQVLNQVAAYIAEEFRQAGADVQFQEFAVQGETYKNVRGVFGAAYGKRIVVGAHYDVCGETPGADDNASAVAGLIALANMAGVQSPPPPLELVAYVLEEPPFFGTDAMGSFYHAAWLRANNIQIRAVICLEMIGYFTDQKHSQDYPIPGMECVYPETGNFIAVVGRVADAELVSSVAQPMKHATDLPVEYLAAPSILPGIALSDHVNYWNHNYHAVMVTDTSFYRNPHYHCSTDTPETLDYLRMSKVVEGLYAVLLTMTP